MLLAWFAIGPRNVANVLPSERAETTAVMSGTTRGCCTAWVKVTRRKGVSIQCRPSAAAFARSLVRAAGGIHCHTARSSSRPSGNTDASRAHTTSAFGRRTSSTPFSKVAPTAPSDSRRRNGASSGQSPVKGASWWKTSLPVKS